MQLSPPPLHQDQGAEPRFEPRETERAGRVEITEAPHVRVRATQLLRDDFARWAADSLSSTGLVSTISANAGWR